MTHKDQLILVIGCGSIGERHVRTMLATGRAKAIACDSRPYICQQMIERYSVPAISDWALELGNPFITGAIIATPAPLHVAMARRCLEAGWNVLIEKPLSISLAGIDQLITAQRQAQRFAAVAYVLHSLPLLQSARQFLQAGGFGAIKHIAINSGHHFPHARPAYREIYYNDHSQGGGAIQDALTHLANTVEWFVGPTSSLYCDAEHQVLPGVTVEDTVNVAARNGDILVNYALNQFQAMGETRLDFHAEKGTVRCELHANRWGAMALGAPDWLWHHSPASERDQMYIDQAHAFIDGCEGKAHSLCTLEEGVQTLRFNFAALKSWRENTRINL